VGTLVVGPGRALATGDHHIRQMFHMRPGLACQLGLPQRVSTRACAGHAAKAVVTVEVFGFMLSPPFRPDHACAPCAGELTIHTDNTAARNDERNRIGGASVWHHASSNLRIDMVDQPSQLHVAVQTDDSTSIWNDNAFDGQMPIAGPSEIFAFAIPLPPLFEQLSNHRGP
jgi:hypothetical protein